MNFSSSSHYIFRKVLGSGGSAEVSLYDRFSDGLPSQEVVLKIVKAPNPYLFLELVNEGKKLRDLKHPHIVTTFGYERVDDQRIALVLEHVQGCSLRDFYEQIELDWRERVASSVLTELLSAVQAAHAAGVVHGDLSPGNVLLSKEGHVKLSDFGLAAQISQENVVRAKGSRGYLAPERLEGHPLDKPSDVFSLGVMAFEILTGQSSRPVPTVWQPFLKTALTTDPKLRGDISKLISLVPEIGRSEGLQTQRYIARRIAKMAGGEKNCTKTKTLPLGVQQKAHQVLARYKGAVIQFCVLLSAALAVINPRAVGNDSAKRDTRPSTLTLFAEPWARVNVDGVSRGATPVIHLVLPSGEHSLTWISQKGSVIARSTIHFFGPKQVAYALVRRSGGRIETTPLR